MKKGKRLLILLAVLILFACGYYGMTLYNAAQKSAEDETDDSAEELPVFETDADTIASIAFTYGENDPITFRAAEDGGKWIVAEDPDFPLDQSFVTAIVNNVKSVKAERLIAESLENASEYGLTEPQITATLTDIEGAETTFYVGNKNSTTGDYYISLQGSQSIWSIAAAMPGKFMYGLYDMISKETYPAVDETLIESVRTASPEGSDSYVYLADGSADVYSTSFTWFLQDENGLTPVNADTLSSYTASAADISLGDCVSYAPTDADLAAFGLDTPACTLTLGYTENMTYTITAEQAERFRQHLLDLSNGYMKALGGIKILQRDLEKQADTILLLTAGETPDTGEDVSRTAIMHKSQAAYIGAADESGENRYFTFDGTNRVYLISAADALTLMGPSSNSLLLDSVCDIPVSTLTGMTLSYGENTVHAGPDIRESVDDNGLAVNTTVYLFDEAEITSSEYASFFALFTGLKVDSRTDAPAGDYEPVFRAVFHRSTEKYAEMTLDIVDYNANFYRVVFNGDSTILINRNDAQKIFAQFTALLAYEPEAAEADGTEGS